MILSIVGTNPQDDPFHPSLPSPTHVNGYNFPAHSPRACPFTVEFTRPWFTVMFCLACKEWATRAMQLSVLRDTAKSVPWWWPPQQPRSDRTLGSDFCPWRCVTRLGINPSAVPHPKCCEKYLSSGPNFEQNVPSPYQTRPRLRRGPLV